MSEHYITKCRAFTDYNDLESLEDALNDFFENKFIISSPIFLKDNSFNCMVYYKIKPVDTTTPKEETKPTMLKASDKQKNFLKRLGFKGNYDISMQEANKLIKELKVKE